VRYVALGDSFTSAPLVPDATGGECWKSTNNYPALVGRALPGTELVDASCGGAATTEMRKPQKLMTTKVPPQFDSLTRETDLVTIGIGGNDFGLFATMIFQCTELAKGDRKGAPCRAAMRTRDGDRLLNYVDRTERRLVRVVKGVKRRSPHARIMLVGYPRIAPSEGHCRKMPIARGDYRYAVQVSRALDRAIERTARRTHVEFVDVYRASRGHDVCSDDPWVNGKDTDLARALFYHPFANEQAAVAQLILDRLA